MDQLLLKMEHHLTPRRPGSRGEPELRRYVLLSNTFKAAQADLAQALLPTKKRGVEPVFDLYDMLEEDDEHMEDAMWLESCLDELVRADEEMDQRVPHEVVLYRDQQVPDALFNDEDEDDEEEASLSIESGVELPWMDDAKAWHVDPLASDDGGGALFGNRFAF
jgi:hypothetical protein